MELREPSEEELSELRERVRPYLSDERYAHTLSVEGECAYMAKILMPEHEHSLRAAALLHDIAKKQTYEKQLNYIRECDILEMEKGKTRIIPAVAHAPAGAAMPVFCGNCPTDTVLKSGLLTKSVWKDRQSVLPMSAARWKRGICFWPGAF